MKSKKILALMLVLLLVLSVLPMTAWADEWEEDPATEVLEETSTEEIPAEMPEEAPTEPEAQDPPAPTEITAGGEIEAPDAQPKEPAPDEPTSIVASGECGSEGDNVTWTLDDEGTLTVSGTGAMADYAQSTETPWFSNKMMLTSIVIEPGVTILGKNVFNSCGNAVSVSIPDTVTTIGPSAFSNCGFASVEIPDSVVSIGAWAFSRNLHMISIQVGNGNENYASVDGVLFSKDLSALICCPAGRSGEYVIPNSVTQIVENAFGNCANLTSILIPTSVTVIGLGAFQNCTGLTSISIPNSVTNMGESVFYNDSGLMNVTLPDSLTSIKRSTFYSCLSLTDINIPAGVTAIESQAFSMCSGLFSINIPEGVTSIGFAAFNGCSALTSIIIPDHVTVIGDNAFQYCSGLTEIIFQGSAPAFGTKAFFRVAATAYYPADDPTWTEDVRQDYGGTITWEAGSVTAPLRILIQPVDTDAPLGEQVRVFVAAQGSELTYQWWIKNAGASRFSKSSVMTSTYQTTMSNKADGRQLYCVVTDKYGNSVTSDTVTISIQSGLTVIASGNCGANGDNLTWTLNAEGTLTISGTGAMADYFDMAGLLSPWHSYSDRITAVVIEPGVTHIGKYAFESHQCMTTAVIPSGVISIGRAAFLGTGLTEISLPGSVTGIEDYAFSACYELTNISVSSDNPEFSSVDGVLFDKNLWTLICCPAGKRGAYTVPATVTRIGTGAFSECSLLTGVTLPSSVKNIGNGVFSECMQLTSITIPADVTLIGGDAFFGCFRLAAILFEGSAPYLGTNMFSEVTATAYYPANDPVKDQYGHEVTTEIVTLSASAPLEIVTQPQNASAPMGQTVSVSVEATGDGLSYQWYIKNAGAAKFSKSSIVSDTYTATMSDKVNGRQIYCVVKDQYGSTVQTDTVTLSAKTQSGDITLPEVP